MPETASGAATKHTALATMEIPGVNVQPPALEPFIEAEEGAPIVRLCPRHIKKLARENKIPAHPFGDGVRHRWRFLASELHAWMRAKVNSACDPGRA